MSVFRRITDFLYRNRRHIATVAFFAGFLVDIITFRTINLTLSQIILAGYLLILAGSILVLAAPARVKSSKIDSFARAWFPVVHQYVAGNILSAFLVLYFSSGSFSASWPFLIVVALAALGNETSFFEKYRVPFQTTLFFLSLVLFFALATPIALHSLGLLTFLFSIGIALAAFFAFFVAGRFFAPAAFKKNARSIAGGALGVSLLVSLLYVTNLIPPIPLSAKSIGAYHSVEKVGDTYVATDEARLWYERFFDIDGVRLRLAPGESAYVYTSIFAPARFGTDVVHQWDRLDASTGKWRLRNTIRFPILGGRPEGYRGYSLVESPEPGRWRVSVKTSGGAVIGRTYIRVERVSVPVDVAEVLL